MIRLGLTREARWLELGNGVSVLASPLTTAIYRAAISTAQRKALGVAEEKGLIDDAGGSVLDIPDPFDRDGIAGLQAQFMLQALATHAITEWKGIGDEQGNAAPVTPQNVAAFIRDFPLFANAFESRYLAEITEMVAEKNDCSAALNGNTAAALNTAKDATPTAGESVPSQYTLL